MRTILNTVFSKINTVVYYQWPGVFLGNDYSSSTKSLIDSEPWKGTKVLYRVTDNNLTNLDLSEYGLSFDLEKNKYNNSLLTPFFDNYTKDLVGNNYTNLFKLENYCVPSSIESNEISDINIGYFGNATSSLDGSRLYILEAPERCSRIELYAESIDHNTEFTSGRQGFYRSDYVDIIEEIIKNNPNDKNLFFNSDILSETRIKPSMVIDLGPDTYESYNTDSMYVSDVKYLDYFGQNNYLLNSGKVRRPLSESLSSYKLSSVDEYFEFYRKLVDEIYGEKLIWFILHNEVPTQVNVNLAQKSFLNSNNALRNKNKYCLRNDDLYKEVLPVKEDQGYFYNSATDTLIGDDFIQNFPILEKKRKLLEIKESNYSNYVTYHKGDVVRYRGKEYKSIVDNNRNNPLISTSWVLKDEFDGYFTKNIHFLSNPPGAITFIPGNATIPKNISEPITITAIENHGYHIDENSKVNAVGSKVNVPLVLKGTGDEYDYTYLNSKSETDDDFKKTFTIVNWEKIVDNKSDKVIFGTEHSDVSIIANIYLDGELVEYSINLESIDFRYSTHDILSETTFSLNNMRPDSIVNISGNLDDEISINFGWISKGSSNLEVSSIKTTHYTVNGIVEKELELDQNNSINDIIDSTDIIYDINLSRKTRRVTVLYNTSEFEVNLPYIEVSHGTATDIKFYPIFNPELDKWSEFSNIILDAEIPYYTKDSITGEATYSNKNETFQLSQSGSVPTAECFTNLESLGYIVDHDSIINYTLNDTKKIDQLTGDTITEYTLHIDNIRDNIVIKLIAKK